MSGTLEGEGRAPVKVVGRYALYGEIAAGGMATVHIGRLLGPVGFARTVAVKRLHAQFAKDPEFVSMFLDEARLAARVQHPNVVATIDVVATDGELFLIMDYVRGETLARLVRATRKRGEHVSPKIVTAIMCGFLHGLHAAHEAKNERGEPLGLIHRDVSPQNVLVGSDGVARVLDFGVAKAAGRIQVTREGQVKGKLSYMPPEQLSGGALTRAVDIYAAAVVLWEAFTGERLFKGDSEGETLHKILRGAVEPPSIYTPGLSQKLDEVCMRALSRDVSRRYGTAREMALALERCEGIASPTDVGEWVERVAGSDLHSREERIAEIESNSAGLSVPHSQLPPDSNSDVSAAHSSRVPSSQRSSRKIEATLVGVGPPSQGTLPLASSPRIDAGAPRSRPRPSPEDSEVSKRQGISGFTKLMQLPMERRLPLLVGGCAALLLLLVIIIGIALSGRKSNDDVTPDQASSASPATSASVAIALSAEPVKPFGDPVAAISAAQSAVAAADSAPAVTAKPTAKPLPWQPTPPVAVQTPPPKKPNCDPPYTLDAKGHKHFKVECN